MNQKIVKNTIYRNRSIENKEITTCCKEPNIMTSEGSLVCTSCGTVAGQDMVNYEERAYTNAEVNVRRRTEKKWRETGPRTFIGKERRDSKGSMLDAKGKTLYNRLDKIQISLISSLERNFWEAKPKLNMLASKLNIPSVVRETAWRIYTECAKEKLTMGRSIIGFIAAALYAAIRIHEVPRLFDEVSDNQLVPRRVVHHSLGKLVKVVLPKLGLKYKPITAQILVYRFGNDLELPMEVQNEAANMIRTAKKNGMNSVGKDPRGIAASALYIASRASSARRDHRTQVVIADIAKITEVTLRSRARDLRNHQDKKI